MIFFHNIDEHLKTTADVLEDLEALCIPILKVFNKIDMVNNEEINKKIDIFSKKVKKKIYTISALKHKGLKTIKEILVSYVH